MKKFKLLITVIAVVFCIQVQSQVIGIKAGVNISTITFSDGSPSEILEGKLGVQLGAVLEFPVGKYFAIETGLQFDQKGSRLDYSTIGSDDLGKCSLSYLDLPISAKLQIKFGVFTLYGKLGSYVGAGLFGNVSETTTVNGVTSEDNRNINFSGDRLDYGVLSGLGLTVSSFQFEWSYIRGIKDLIEEGLGHKTISFTLGYRFGGK